MHAYPFVAIDDHTGNQWDAYHDNSAFEKLPTKYKFYKFLNFNVACQPAVLVRYNNNKNFWTLNNAFFQLFVCKKIFNLLITNRILLERLLHETSNLLCEQ